jgi:hypothetical protein
MEEIILSIYSTNGRGRLIQQQPITRAGDIAPPAGIGLCRYTPVGTLSVNVVSHVTDNILHYINVSYLTRLAAGSIHRHY